MSDFLIEVDEALKQERLEKLWGKYGGFFIGFLAVVVLGTATNAGYQSWVQNRNFKQTNIYIDAVSTPDVTAQQLLDITGKMTPELREVVKLRAAGIAIENGNLEVALSIYKDLGNNNKNDEITTLAKYMATNLDKNMSVEDKIKSYDTLIADKNIPWRFHAMLDAALLEANVSKDYKKARKYLSQITNEQLIAESLKKKAQSLDILYEAMESSQNNAKK